MVAHPVHHSSQRSNVSIHLTAIRGVDWADSMNTRGEMMQEGEVSLASAEGREHGLHGLNKEDSQGVVVTARLEASKQPTGRWEEDGRK